MPSSEGFRIYIQKINDEGGINGRRIKLMLKDDGGSGAKAATDIKKFVEAGADASRLAARNQVMAQFIGSSLVLASLYALTALGFVIIYRSSRILNLAHGELFMLGGYFCFVMIPLTGGNVWAGVENLFFPR